MTVYKINEKDRKVNLGKVVLRRIFISLFGCLIYTVVFLIMQKDISAAYNYLAIVCGISFLINALLIPVDVSKKKKENEVFRVKIDETTLRIIAPNYLRCNWH
ncbi:MAG: hypothetical protein MUF24_08640 [Chitinophagaceae bacterium]|jgi:hypothetical protein|nr:hypothetical protein [Chitinophagaceae bacterium]